MSAGGERLEEKRIARRMKSHAVWRMHPAAAAGSFQTSSALRRNHVCCSAGTNWPDDEIVANSKRKRRFTNSCAHRRGVGFGSYWVLNPTSIDSEIQQLMVKIFSKELVEDGNAYMLD